MAVTDPADKQRDAYAPFLELMSITPSDSTVYSPPLRGVIVSADGDVVVKTYKNQTSVTIAALKGQLIPALITHVMAATTATVVGGR